MDASYNCGKCQLTNHSNLKLNIKLDQASGGQVIDNLHRETFVMPGFGGTKKWDFDFTKFTIDQNNKVDANLRYFTMRRSGTVFLDVKTNPIDQTYTQNEATLLDEEGKPHQYNTHTWRIKVKAEGSVTYYLVRKYERAFYIADMEMQIWSEDEDAKEEKRKPAYKEAQRKLKEKHEKEVKEREKLYENMKIIRKNGEKQKLQKLLQQLKDDKVLTRKDKENILIYKGNYNGWYIKKFLEREGQIPLEGNMYEAPSYPKFPLSDREYLIDIRNYNIYSCLRIIKHL